MDNNEFDAAPRGCCGRPARRASSTPCWLPSAPICAIFPGFTGSNGTLLILPGTEPSCSPTRATRFRRRRKSTCQIRIAKGPLVPDVVGGHCQARLRRIGYEPARMTCD